MSAPCLDAVFLDKAPDGAAFSLVQIRPRLFFDWLRDAVESFGDTSGDAADGVTISTDPNRIANGILKVLSLEHTNDGLRYTILANTAIPLPIDALPRIASLQFLDRHREVVTEISLYPCSNVRSRMPLPRQKDTKSSRLRPLDALWMIMRTARRDFGRL